MKFSLSDNKDDLPLACLLHNNPNHNCRDCVWWIMRERDRLKGSAEAYYSAGFRVFQDIGREYVGVESVWR